MKETKSRKVLRITFPTSLSNTLFAWDGHVVGYKRHNESLNVMVVEVQRRSERSEMARKARMYGATTETIIVG